MVPIEFFKKAKKPVKAIKGFLSCNEVLQVKAVKGTPIWVLQTTLPNNTTNFPLSLLSAKIRWLLKRKNHKKMQSD